MISTGKKEVVLTPVEAGLCHVLLLSKKIAVLIIIAANAVYVVIYLLIFPIKIFLTFWKRDGRNCLAV